MHRHCPVVPFRAVLNRHRAFVRSLATVALFAAIPSLSMAQTVKIHGTVAPGVSIMTSAGPLDPTKTLTLDIRFALRNHAQLERLIAAQMNPNSPYYHQWITPEVFTRRFGPDSGDFSSVQDWLAANGFRIIDDSREEGYIRFIGDAATTERVFKIRFEDFRDGKFANVTEPEIPAQFANVIGDILGMENLGPLQPAYQSSKLQRSAQKLPASRRDARSISASGAAFNLANIGRPGFTFAAPDFYAFYNEYPLLNAGNTGANDSDCIGIFAASNIYPEPSQATILSDYFKFFSQYTAFSTDPSLTIDLSKESDPGVVDEAPFYGRGLDLEAYLDIEAAHLVAPGAPITLYVTNPHLTGTQTLSDALTAMTSENEC